MHFEKGGKKASSVLEARCDRAWPGMGKALLSGHGLRCVMCGGPMCLTSPARSKDYLCQLLEGGGQGFSPLVLPQIHCLFRMHAWYYFY